MAGGCTHIAVMLYAHTDHMSKGVVRRREAGASDRKHNGYGEREPPCRGLYPYICTCLIYIYICRTYMYMLVFLSGWPRVCKLLAKDNSIIFTVIILNEVFFRCMHSAGSG